MLRPLLILLLLLGPGLARAEPSPLSVPGEITQSLPGIHADTMARYRQTEITHITFHHEGFAGEDADLFRRASAARDKQTIAQRVRNIHRYHAASAGLGMIAYHYAVDKAGQIAKGRPVRFKPATRSTVWNGATRADFKGHFAVVALGDFNHEKLTPAARLSYVRVMSAAQRAYRVPTTHIQPHRSHANTSCPGKHILAEAETLPRMVLVYSLQAELQARGCLSAAPDGAWGPKSNRAFNRFARQNRDFARALVEDRTLFAMLDAPGLTCK